MKHTAAHVIKTTVESRELELFAVNDRDIYTQITAAANYFAKKLHKGLFDEAKAVDRLYPVATAAAKKYCREFGGLYYQIFDVTARYTCAAELAEVAKERALELLEEM